MKYKVLNISTAILSTAVALACAFSLRAAGQNGFNEFMDLRRQIGSPSGVTCICAEDEVYAWIGTPEGLIRYDGRAARKYTSRDESGHALPDDEICQVLRDSLGNVWVMTSGGVALYRPQTDDFYVPTLGFETLGLGAAGGEARSQGNGLSDVRSACLVPGGVLFGGTEAIYKYSYPDGRISLYARLSGVAERQFSIEKIVPWHDGTLLLSNRWLGIVALDPPTEGGSWVARPLSYGSLALMVDSEGRVWVSPYNRGIECYDAAGERIAAFNTGNSALSNDIVLCLAEKDGLIWAGTDGGGINVIDPVSGRIEVLRHVSGNGNSLPGNSIKTISIDRSGDVWAGQVKGGLCVIRRTGIRHYGDCPPGETFGLSEKTVNCIYQEPRSSLVWIGTNGEGVNCYDPRSGKFTRYPATEKIKVTSITSCRPGELLLSTFSYGLFVLDTRTGRMSPLKIGNEELEYQMYYSGKAVNLLQEGENSVLMMADSLYRYDRRNGTIGKVGFNVRPTGILQAIGRRGGKAWLHDPCAIYEVSPSSSRAEEIFRFGADTLINSVFAAGDGTFVIASNRGVGSFDPASGQYRHISTTLFRAAYSAVEDQLGRLWIGTDHDLFAYIPETGRMVMLDESDGAAPNEYRPKARLLSPSGDVYLGGVNGLLRIDHDLRISPTEDFDIVLTDVELDGERANARISNGVLRASYENKLFRLRVHGRDRDFFGRKLYRFIIRGYFDEPVETYEPEIELRFPTPGNYSVEVSCNTKDGRWLPYSRVLTLSVSPPWYRTTWFVALCVILAALTLIFGVLAILKRRRDRMDREYMRKEQELNEEKVRFLINICHELKTPLTLVMASLSRLTAQDGAQSQPYLSMIGRQAKRMKELVDSILLVRKMEVGDTTIFMEPHSLNEWVGQTVEDFKAEAELKDISLRFEPDETIGTVSFDAQKSLIALNNLILNALNHSPNGSEIVIRTERDTPRGFVRVIVTDQGTGLGNVDASRLFKRFYQGRGETSGTGIGLSASKILIEQQGGAIGALGNPSGPGATFYFELPVGTGTKQIVSPAKNYLNEIFAAGEADSAEEVGNGQFDLSDKDILIVDDDREFTDFLGAELERRVGRVITAANGVEALDLLGRESMDVVVSDVNMPLMDGYDLCREVKTRIEISHIPIILLTQYDDERNRLLGYKNGADGYLTKPFDIEVLLVRIGNILHNRQLMRDKYRQTAAKDDAPEETMTFSSADEEFISKLNAIIRENITQPELGIPFLCQELGMSRTALYNKLKAVTGMNIKDYINRIRMELAISLVVTTKLPFSEISEKTGFSSSRYFSTAFKQYTGETPSDYRSLGRPR